MRFRVLQKLLTAARKTAQYGLLPVVRTAFETLLGGVRSSHHWEEGAREAMVCSPKSFSVAIVIPTKDGGSDLERLLTSLALQEGCELEVFLVDSSSHPMSIERSVFEGQVSTIPITATEFSHSFARNLGVARSSAPLVFLTVQDAELPDKDWLHDLCCLLNTLGLEALSVAEKWRDDCDFYGKFAVGSYNRSLFPKNEGVIVSSQEGRSRSERIYNASIGNVGCLYRREALVQTPFVGEFGEDLLLGISLLKKGQKVGRTNTLSVLHSHSRTPLYWMHRMAASRRLLDCHNLTEPLRISREKQVCSVIEGLLDAVDLVLAPDSPEQLPKREPMRERGAAKLGDLDPQFSAWIQNFPWSPVRSSPWGGEYLGLARDMVRFADEEHLSDIPAIAYVQAFAGRLGWILGSCPSDQTWSSNAVEARMLSLGKGV